MTNISNRLKKVRAEKHLTQEALGNFIGVSKQAIANVESSHSKPSIEFMSKLFENLNVNLNWLIAGQGEMFNAPKFEDVREEILNEVDKLLKARGL